MGKNKKLESPPRKILFSTIFDSLMPVFATIAALLVGAVFLLILGANPITVYARFLDGAFGNFNAFAETLVKATPLLRSVWELVSLIVPVLPTSEAKGR